MVLTFFCSVERTMTGGEEATHAHCVGPEGHGTSSAKPDLIITER